MPYLTPEWSAPSNVKSIITTKKTLSPIEQPVDHADYRINYQQALIKQLSLPSEPIWLSQTHSNTVIEAQDAARNMHADASIALRANTIAVVFTADCLPILVCNQAGTKVGAIHAGWRGLLHGIIGNTLQLMGESPDDLLIHLGPAIGPAQFEVGQDVYDAFTQKSGQNRSAFHVKNETKWLADIYMLARIQLHTLGVDTKQITGGTHCTVSESDLFYSYRRDHGKTGRMASLIWLDNS